MVENRSRISEMTSGLQGRNRILLTLGILMGCVVAALLSLYLVNRITEKATVIQNVGIDSKTLVALGAMRQTSTRNGIKEWTLNAASAKILKEEHLAILTDISVHFFLAGGGEIHLTSRNGSLDTEKHDMTFSDTVVVRHQDKVLETDRLQYEKKRHIIYSLSPVVLSSPRAEMTANALTLDINARTVKLTGNVKGFFKPDSNM